MTTIPDHATTQQTRDMWKLVAESARCAHHAAAAQEDYALYKRSEVAFKAALDAAYPEIGSGPLYELWLDSMETIAYYVELWGKMSEDDRARWQ
jgi:hypothetical protein